MEAAGLQLGACPQGAIKCAGAGTGTIDLLVSGTKGVGRGPAPAGSS